MAIDNEIVVNTTSKYIVKSTGIKDEKDQELVDANKLTGADNESLVSLIECYYLIEGTGTLTISTTSESADLTLTGKGKYGLRPEQLKFGNDKIFKLTTDANVKSYLLVTEFRRN
jgi:hypothetical protein